MQTYVYEQVTLYGQLLIAVSYLLRPGRSAKYCDEYDCFFVRLSVCSSLCLSVCVTRKPHGRTSSNFWTRCPWPSLGPLLTALRYVMYFRWFRGRHHVFIPWSQRVRIKHDISPMFGSSPCGSTNWTQLKTTTVFGRVYHNAAPWRCLPSTIDLLVI